jgi:hypothetical protein
MKKIKERINYFGKVEEDAVIEYILTNSTDRKHEIYNKILRKPFDKMVSSILRKYNNYIGNYDIMDVEAYGLSHLIENMVKYRPFIIEYKDIDSIDDKWKKHKTFRYFFEEEITLKLEELNNNDDLLCEYRRIDSSAYSYCGTIVRNFFRDHSKNSRIEVITNVDLYGSGINFDEDINFSYEQEFYTEEDRTLIIFKGVIEELEKTMNDNVITDKLTNNEVTVGYAILDIFKNMDKLFTENTDLGEYDKKITNNFSKQKIFLILKEYTRMETKDIRLNMKPYMVIFEKLIIEWKLKTFN